MLGEGPIRMLSAGQELCSDLDEKYLLELGFKDMQVSGSASPRHYFQRVLVIKLFLDLKQFG